MRDRKPKLLDEEGLRGAALRMLGARGYSTSELRDKLRRRAERVEDVDRVIAGLKEYGYLNDSRFAEAYAHARLHNEGHGSRRVLRDLRGKRVAPTVADRAVKQAFEGTEEITLVEQYLARKYRNTDLHQLLQDPTKLAAVYRRLRYAGFTAGPAISVLKRYANQAEELEDMDDEGEQSGHDGSETP
jgi:regulatory protein